MVVLIGISGLSITFYWNIKSQEKYLRNFSLLYFLFTLLITVEIIQKYLNLNVPQSSTSILFNLYGVSWILDSAIVIVGIYFFQDLYQTHSEKTTTLFFFLLELIGIGLVVSPNGIHLNRLNNSIEIGKAALIATGMHIFTFMYLLARGFCIPKRIRRSSKKELILGLLIFTSIGFLETVISFVKNIHNPVSPINMKNDFLFSTIPYAIYGIFIISYFLKFSLPSPAPLELDEAFIKEHGITKREKEIIQMVLQGKSNTEIAKYLFISISTVKTHLNNLYKKIQVESRFDLIVKIRKA
jgi:DNA-binding CsgD family transcriptional regulator